MTILTKAYKFAVKKRIYTLPILFFVVIAILFSLWIGKYRVYLHNEHEFSFEYRYHAVTAFNEIVKGDQYQKDITRCIDCEGYTDYNRWHYLFKSALLAVPELFGLHPEAGFWLIQTLPIYLSWIFLLRSFKRHTGVWAANISAFLYTFIPIRLSYMFGASTLTNFQYSMITFMIGLMVRMNRETHWSRKLLLSILTGICLSFTFNIGLSNLHNSYIIFFGIGIYQFLNNYHHKFRIIPYHILSFVLAVCINLPLVYQHLLYSIQITYPSFVSTSMFDAVSLQMVTGGIPLSIIILFFVIAAFGVLISPVTKKKKLLLFLVYFIAADLVAGDGAPVKLARVLFENVPTFTTLRSMYRFNFYQIIIATYGIYWAMENNFADKRYNVVLKSITMVVVLVMISISLTTFIDSYPSFVLPHEYESAAQELRNLEGNKLYFPPHPHPYKDILHSYKWPGTEKIDEKFVSYYSNPFKTVYAVPDVYQMYDLGRSPKKQLYRMLFDLENQSVKDIVAAVNQSDFTYLVIDKNYLWSALYPAFKIDEFMSHFRVYKSYGNIVLLEVKGKGPDCPQNDYYFDHASICSDLKEIDHFEEAVRTGEISMIKIKSKYDYMSFIMWPGERTHLRSEGVLMSTYMKVFQSPQKNVFDLSEAIPANFSGKIIVPVLLRRMTNEPTEELNLVIHDSKKTIQNINLYTQNLSHYEYLEVPIDRNTNRNISIDLNGKGSVIFLSNPFFTKNNSQFVLH
ncbi:MAG: hypothetical protein WCO78_04470 [Candidatus Roizmanbacteria bacterium]